MAKAYEVNIAKPGQSPDLLQFKDVDIHQLTNASNAGKVLGINDAGTWLVAKSESTGLIMGTIITSPLPLTVAGLHLADGTLLDGTGTFSDFVTAMITKYNADPTGTWHCTEEEWQAEVTAHGVCGKFVVNTTNETVRLPKLGDKIYTDQINIGGFAPVVAFPAGVTPPPGGQGNNVPLFLNAANDFGGSSYLINKANTINLSALAAGALPSVFTDLSKSTGVTINQLHAYYYIVVGTVTKTDIEIDIDQIIADLNNKADKDLGNVDPELWGAGIPDYTAGVALSGWTTTNTEFTVPSNGYIHIVTEVYGGWVEWFYVDDMLVCAGNSMQDVAAFTTAACGGIFIKRGTHTFRTSGAPARIKSVTFYPLKGDE